jgi:hypothetical protein
MLRLLSEEDLAPLGVNRGLLRKLRSQRIAIFRGYVKCFSRDYADLLSAISVAALHSSTDRPDLAWLVLQNRVSFAAALCRLDAMVCLYRFGFCGVDVSGVVRAMESLRTLTAVSVSGPAALPASV